MSVLKFGVVAPVAAGVTADPGWMTAFARHLEACGFESIVVVEHTVLATRYDSVYPYDRSGRVELAADCPVPDPLDLLSFLAGHTDRLGLATGVLVLPNHHPVVLAKRAATVDVLSSGRLRLCVGVGWLREEIEACGTDFQSRGRRADEQLAVLRALWEGRAAGLTHHGEFFHFENVICSPKPVAGQHLPVHIGGHSKAAARRAGRFGDGFQPLGVAGAQLDGLLALMRDEAAAADRDPADIEVSLGHSVTKIDAERAERLAAQGADRLVLAMPPITDLEQAKDELSACAQRLSLPA
jgi:probable F420-dependent oxidoreductase